MERLGRGLPVLGHVLEVVAVVGSEEDDMAAVVGVRREVNAWGANAVMDVGDW